MVRFAGKIGKAALLVAVALLTTALHRQMPTRGRAAEGDIFVPRPEVARLSAFGFDAVLSDYYWMQAVQVVGSQNVVEQKAYLLGALVDVVTTLNPRVSHPYRFAAVWLTDSEASVRKAIELLRRGIAQHPGDWRNYFYLGFDHFWYFDEYAEAAAVLEQAMEMPGSPAYLRRLVARLRAGGDGGLAAAEHFLHGLLLEARSDEERAQYEGALLEIETERRARVLDEARERYKQRHGRDIERVADLVEGPDPVLAALPPEPQGGSWRFEDYTGRIVSDVLRHRYEAKLDKRMRKRIEKVRGSDDKRGEQGDERS